MLDTLPRFVVFPLFGAACAATAVAVGALGKKLEKRPNPQPINLEFPEHKFQLKFRP